MTRKQVAPYGSWKSPISSDVVAFESMELGEVLLDGEDTYWIEMRPAEGGRSVIVLSSSDGQVKDAIPPPFDSRTRVHEYGGGSFLVNVGTIYFSNFSDQRLYRKEKGSSPEPLTPATKMRYADMVFDNLRKRIICVREDHRGKGHYPINTLVSIGTDEVNEGEVMASGSDFYSSPCLSPDGSLLAWLSWNHPNMPWDGTGLWVGGVKGDGSLGRKELVAGGPNESIFQPEWSPSGVLHFVSDKSGWWSPYRWANGRKGPLLEMEAEFGRPQWVFGMYTYAFESSRRMICAYTQRGIWHLAILDMEKQRLEPIRTPYTQIWGIRAKQGRAVFCAGSPLEATCVVQLGLSTQKRKVLRKSSHVAVDKGYLSSPESIEFPTEGGVTAYAFLYLPSNRDYLPPQGDRLPLMVISHGGPTASASTRLRSEVQYWTSRGIAVLDVNYGGSTGYGRDYRERLKGKWGVVDVDDCVNAALDLVRKGLVDGNKLAIRGGSAGGYTTLCALTFRQAFKGGSSYYGVSDLEALAKETHKFESRYLDSLVGPYPKRRDLYIQRSPIHFADLLSSPVVFFQGLEDKIVPPNQAETMFKALREKGVPVAYVPFEGEQHGFRRAKNIKRAIEAELYFFSKIFGFRLPEPLEKVHIENL